MDGQWLTYRELADKLGVSVEAAWGRALRAGWARRSGSGHGRARVLLPDDYEIDRRADCTPDVQPDVDVTCETLIAVLKAHVDTLKAQLASAEARAADEVAKAAGAIRAWEAHVETLMTQLSAAEARSDAEAAKAAETIRAWEAHAKKLEAMALASVRADELRRPWWRRLIAGARRRAGNMKRLALRNAGQKLTTG